MQATARQSAPSVEYEARQASIVRRLRSEAAAPSAIVREAARIIRWFDQPQPDEAIGPTHGIVSDEAFHLVDDAYQLVALVHTATGRPGLQIAAVGRGPADVPEADRQLFYRIVERISRDRVVTDWMTARRYGVAIDVPVHRSLVRAVTSNRVRFARCEDPVHHNAAFVVPSGWHA